MKTERLLGIIDTNHTSKILIEADDGDYYDFETTEKYEIGDRVSFLSEDTPEAFELALMGGPIPAMDVRKIDND